MKDNVHIDYFSTVLHTAQMRATSTPVEILSVTVGCA
jgi:hypothetical protein